MSSLSPYSSPLFPCFSASLISLYPFHYLPNTSLLLFSFISLFFFTKSLFGTYPCQILACFYYTSCFLAFLDLCLLGFFIGTSGVVCFTVAEKHIFLGNFLPLLSCCVVSFLCTKICDFAWKLTVASGFLDLRKLELKTQKN